MPRKTKANQGKEAEIMTRKTRKMASSAIAAETSVSTAEDAEIEGTVEVPSKQRRNLPKRKKGKGKVMRVDSVEGLNARYNKILKDTFSEMNTDRTYDNFDVDCEITVPAPGHILINARLIKGDYFIYANARYALSYPGTIMEVACDLYDAMMCFGLETSIALGA